MEFYFNNLGGCTFFGIAESSDEEEDLEDDFWLEWLELELLLYSLEELLFLY